MSLKSEYQHLRKIANARGTRLENAGFSVGYRAPKASDLTEGELKKEFRKLEKWLNSPGATVKGARILAEERAERAEAARLRKNERERERYKAKKEAEGKTVKTREKLTEEQRKERKREYQRRYRAEKREFKNELKALKESNPEVYNALNNLLQGLKKYGIKVKNMDELKAWGDYIKERSKDSDPSRYEFDQWLDEAAEHANKDVRKLTADDINRFKEDFNEWQSNNEDLQAEFLRPRTSTEYDSAQMGNLWDVFVKAL